MKNHYDSPIPIAINITQWMLLCTAATFGSIFAFNTLSPISTILGLIVAVAIIGLNFAESYLVRFAIASWRFGFDRLGLLSTLGALMIAAYSIMAGFNVVESYLIKNSQSALATDYDIAAAKQRIQAAKSEALNSFDFGRAQSDYQNKAAAENEKIAALLREKPANISSVAPSTAATFISVALEVAIIGLTAFIELFLKPTPLPALVRFNDKLVEWSLNDSQLQNLEITASPSAGTVGLPDDSKNHPSPCTSTLGGVEEVQIEMVEDHFKQWVNLITQKALKPTVKATKQYLRSECGQSMEVAQVTAQEYLERGYNQGYLDINDKKGAFEPQYVLADQKLLGQG